MPSEAGLIARPISTDYLWEAKEGRNSSLKERPLINAVDRLGPIPGFMSGGSFSAGVFTIIMCAAFGGFTIMFHAYGRGFVDAAGLYQHIRYGAYGGVAFGFLIVLISVIAANASAAWRKVSGDDDEDIGAGEAREFLFGAAAAMAALGVLDFFLSPYILDLLAGVGSVVGTPGWM